MTTALEFARRRVRFVPRSGELRVVGPADEDLRQELRDEVARRAALVRPGLPLVASVPAPLLPIVSPPPARVAGACWSCGDAMLPGRGGQCALCTLAVQKALREAGRLPAASTEVAPCPAQVPTTAGDSPSPAGRPGDASAAYLSEAP